MPTTRLAFEIDYAQPRLSTPRVVSVITGRLANEDGGVWRDGWSSTYQSDVWVDPVRKTLMLLPGPVDVATWATSNSGIYAKLAKASFTFTTSSKWNDKQVQSSGDIWIAGEDETTAETAITTAVWGQNVGAYFGWFIHSAGSGNEERLFWGFQATVPANIGASTGLAFGCRTDGRVSVYYGGVKLGEGSLEGKDTQSQTAPGGGETAGYRLDMMVLPIREREILIYSPRRGGGFAIPIPESVVADPANIISSTDKLWAFQTLGTAEWQIAKVQFKSSGYACGVGNVFTTLPVTADQSGETFSEEVYVDGSLGAGTATASIRSITNTTYTLAQPHRLRVDLTGSGTATPYVYGARAGWGAGIEYTEDADRFDLAPYTLEAHLSVPDSHENEELTITVKNPRSLEEDSVDRLRSMTGRPIRVRAVNVDGTTATPNIVYFEGVVSEVSWVQSANTEMETCQLRCRSLWALLDEYVFEAPLPLDGLSLEEAFRAICNTAGIPDEYLSYNPSGYTIETRASPDDGFNFEARYHERASEAINRLIETYAPTYMIRELPGADHVLVQLASPEDLGDESTYQITVYDTTAEAVASSGLDAADVWKVLQRDYEEQSLEPEANDITIAGFDPATKKAILGHYAYAEAANPTVSTAMRVDEWIGSKRIYDFRNSMITTEAAMDRAMELLQQRLIPRRTAASWTSELLFALDDTPVWRGDGVQIMAGSQSAGTVRVGGLGLRCVLEPETGRLTHWRPTHYNGQYLSATNVGAPMGLSATDASGMLAEWQLKLGQIKGFQVFAARKVAGPPSLFKEYPRLW